MTRTLAVVILGGLAALAVAAGDQPGGHGGAGHMMMRQGQDMSGMHQSMAGTPGDPAKVSRTIEIAVDDNIRYVPDTFSVKTGETVRLFAKNSSKLAHELLLGTPEELKAHAEQMRAMPNMQHAAPNMIALRPGQRGGLVSRFDAPGTFAFACLMPGHMEAGIKGTVVVE